VRDLRQTHRQGPECRAVMQAGSTRPKLAVLLSVRLSVKTLFVHPSNPFCSLLAISRSVQLCISRLRIPNANSQLLELSSQVILSRVRVQGVVYRGEVAGPNVQCAQRTL
jgi:hypothetical protein